MNFKEKTRARAYRETLSLVENTNGTMPIVQVINPCLRRHGLHKRPSRHSFVFQQGRVSLCWVKESPPNRLFKVNFRKKREKKFIYSDNKLFCLFQQNRSLSKQINE